MEIKFNKLTPDLMVLDVAKTVKFYTEILGFELAMLVPEEDKRIETELVDGKKYVYAMVKRDGVFFMFMRKDAYELDIPPLKDTPIGASLTFYCEVKNLDKLYDNLKNKKIEIVKDLSTTWYGRKEFYIKDCNGYILGFAGQVN